MKLRISFAAIATVLALMLLLQGCARKEETPSQTPAAGQQAVPDAPAEPAETAARPKPSGDTETAAESAAAAEQAAETSAAPQTPSPSVGGTRPAQPVPARVPKKDPNVFLVRFQTTKGVIDIECHKDWAPIGVARFRELVEAGYYDGARFFRVVPGFVVQFGIAANPLITAKWEESEIKDDPVLQSNTRGMVSFATAGPNTRTTQMFINLADNVRLDSMGFSPIGRVVRGMDTVDSIDSRYGESPQQPLIEDQGEQYLSAQFPYLDKINSAKVID